jgi:signal transduction histidine kinase/CheY-like chemotaxis protein
MSLPLHSVNIPLEGDVVLARQRARTIARMLGFEAQDQTRLATATSEIARNAYRYAHGGQVHFELEGKTVPQVLLIRVMDGGPGIPELARILRGEYHSATGMGLGLVGARRLVDRFQVDTSPAGTSVWLRKLLPPGTPLFTAADLQRVSRELARERPDDPLAELQRQNQELLRALGDLRARTDDLVRVNLELDDTNRGVVALYAELDERAGHLRRADELKSRFLSNMSHEFRTPLNSILALSRLLLDRLDGDLTSEQVRQVEFIRKAAQDLSELVGDLLDLAKVEAGKVDVHPRPFEVAGLFGALRGMLRPLLVGDTVGLVFHEPDDMPTLHTDEAKVSQILRNFISNALKFTERGEIRVSAATDESRDHVVFDVKDTGIGIAPADQERIFEDFTQLDNPVQAHVKGTGLGLPLCRKLAHLLGGQVSVRSAPGSGSTFTLTVPRMYAPVDQSPPAELPAPDPARVPVLVVEDAPEDQLLYEKYLKGSEFQMIPARSLEEARRALAQIRPRAIILDILLGKEDSWGFLAAAKAEAAPQGIPVLVVTTVEDRAKGLALGADAYAVKPIDRAWLLRELRKTLTSSRRRVLVIDDDAIVRYLLRQALYQHEVVEAVNGEQGLAEARRWTPDVILLDLLMPDLNGTDVLERLASDARTREIPVVVLTATELDEPHRKTLAKRSVAIVSKDALARGDRDNALTDALAQLGLVSRAANRGLAEADVAHGGVEVQWATVLANSEARVSAEGGPEP